MRQLSFSGCGSGGGPGGGPIWLALLDSKRIRHPFLFNCGWKHWESKTITLRMPRLRLGNFPSGSQSNALPNSRSPPKMGKSNRSIRKEYGRRSKPSNPHRNGMGPLQRFYQRKIWSGRPPLNELNTYETILEAASRIPQKLLQAWTLAIVMLLAGLRSVDVGKTYIRHMNDDSLSLRCLNFKGSSPQVKRLKFTWITRDVLGTRWRCIKVAPINSPLCPYKWIRAYQLVH